MDPDIFIAIDKTEMHEVMLLIAELQGMGDLGWGGVGFKINLDFMVKHGIENTMNIIRGITKAPVFVDLKMWNGKRTMTDMLRMLDWHNVDYTNIYGLAGKDVIKTVITEARPRNLKVLGLTILTHYDEAYCQHNYRCSLPSMVTFLAGTCRDAGCYGVILPTTMLETTQNLQGIKRVCPGIRPVWYEDKRHEQQMTPSEAIKAGADMLVVGSPVTKQKTVEDRRMALTKILQEVHDARTNNH